MKKKGNTVIIIIVAIVVLLLVCGIASFFIYTKFIRKEVNENLAENIIESVIENESGSDADVDIDGDDSSIHLEDGDASIDISSDTEWPSTIPSSVPEFTYGSQISSTYVDGDSGEGWTMAFESADSDAYENYKSDLESSGWSIISTGEVSGMKILSATKDDMTISFTYDSQDSAVTLSVGIDN